LSNRRTPGHRRGAASGRRRLASGRVAGPPAGRGGGGPMKMAAFSGQQLAQVDNPDPFAPPVWRSPIYHTPGWVILIAQLGRALVFRGRVLVPVLGKVRSTRYTDRVAVRLVSGQAAADFAARVENLANGFGALLCRVRTARPGFLILEFVRRDALAAIIPALVIPEQADLKALAAGRREDGSPWLLRLHGKIGRAHV